MNAKEIVMALVKPGDTIKVKAISKLPNMSGEYKVDYITNDGYLYDVSAYSDGYLLPFYAIKEISIIG